MAVIVKKEIRKSNIKSFHEITRFFKDDSQR